MLIKNLNRWRGYKTETFYMGVNIADHFMSKLAMRKQKVPNLVLVGITTLFLAAKVE